MPDILTVRESSRRAKAEGIPLSEYTIRAWIREGKIPVRKVGRKFLVHYPNLIRFVQCADGCDNAPATVADAPGIRRISVR